MKRAELETTARIDRDELLALLLVTTPGDQQPITARARISDIEAELARQSAAAAPPAHEPAKNLVLDVSQQRIARKMAKAAKRAARKAGQDVAPSPVASPVTSAEPARLFNDVNWDELLTAAVSAMVTPKQLEPSPPPVSVVPRPNRTPSRAFARLVTRLPTSEPGRFPRGTRSPSLRRPTTQSESVAEQRAAQAVADVRSRLDTQDDVITQRDVSCDRVAFPVLSRQVASHLSGEEIAMLPMEIRLALPETTAWETPPRIVMTPVPGHDCIAIHSTPGRTSQQVTTPASTTARSRVVTIVATAAASVLVGLATLYFLL